MTGTSGGRRVREWPDDAHDCQGLLGSICTRLDLRGMVYLHLECGQPPGSGGITLAHTYGPAFGDRLKDEHLPLLRKLVRYGRQCVAPVELAKCDVARAVVKKLGLTPASGLLFPLHGPQGCFAIALALHDDEVHLAEKLPLLHCHLVRFFEHFMQQMAQRRAAGAPAEELSQRELECLYWCACGKSYWETAMILGISERTVNHHMTMARNKLGVQSNAQAVALASLAGLFLDYICTNASETA